MLKVAPNPRSAANRNGLTGANLSDRGSNRGFHLTQVGSSHNQRQSASSGDGNLLRSSQGPMNMKREKLFGWGRCVPVDRNEKARILVRGRALLKRTKKGKHYGSITAKAFSVLRVLLYGFHNAASGRCFPSYDAIAVAADCARSTVHAAITMLEAVGLITWHHRIKRVVEAGVERVLRSSNAYRFLGIVTKSDLLPGTPTKILPPVEKSQDSGLEASIERAEAAFKKRFASA